MIIQDSVPPVITPVYVNSSTARFKILMHYDNKNSVIWSEQLNKKIPMKGLFELKVTDRAGNTSTFTQKIP
jgi:hypothetical protein